MKKKFFPIATAVIAILLIIAYFVCLIFSLTFVKQIIVYVLMALIIIKLFGFVAAIIYNLIEYLKEQ